MAGQLLKPKAPQWGAFFVIGLILVTNPLFAACPAPPSESEPATVRFVSDGDTVVFGDQRRVRLIGINTPELGHKGQLNQPLAIRARDRLRQLLLSSNHRVIVKLGQEPQDRHGRWLAHLYLPDGQHIGEQLIREGHGWMVAVTPNITTANCLKAAENAARESRQGVWSNAFYTPIKSTALKLRTRGFHFIQGRIQQVQDRPTARWLLLNGRFSIRIPKSALTLFTSPPDRSWIGRKITVRGWLYAHRGKLHVNLEHPAAMDIIPLEQSTTWQ
ncbi:MAG: thermonuclease family protein [Gammaproteobacteria bacterium]